jgi:EAL domain-containing protein (putative c-di-GMP-specific phosphodiesterase class I)
MLVDFEETASFVRSLRDLGCRVALDDFGAGFTTLRHLQALPIDTVKIDGTLIRDLGRSDKAASVLRHSVGLARSLGLVTIAECVENDVQARMLRSEGVDFLQGWLLGRPRLTQPWSEPTSASSIARRAGSGAH